MPECPLDAKIVDPLRTVRNTDTSKLGWYDIIMMK